MKSAVCEILVSQMGSPNGQNLGPSIGYGRPHGEPEPPLGVIMASLAAQLLAHTIAEMEFCRIREMSACITKQQFRLLDLPLNEN
jgi:hypothetical protein